MYINKWIGWVMSTALATSGLIASSATAQPPNQSDITGTNIWNNTAPVFRNDGKLKPEILDNARRLSQQLAESSARCCNTAPQPTGSRRFARTPGNPNQVCTNPDCEKLNSLVQETKTFLDDVNRTQAQQLDANRNRTW